MKKILGVGAALVLAGALTMSTSMAGQEPTNDLQKLYMEEKTAFTTYEKAASQFDGERPFSKIVNSEKRHMELVKDLAELKNTELSDDLIEVSDFSSYKEAIDKAIAIEKEDIKVLKEMLNDKNLSQEEKDIYQRLLDGSERHLKAFERVKENDYKKAEPGSMNGKDRQDKDCPREDQAMRRGRQHRSMQSKNRDCPMNNEEASRSGKKDQNKADKKVDQDESAKAGQARKNENGMRNGMGRGMRQEMRNGIGQGMRNGQRKQDGMSQGMGQRIQKDMCK